MKKIICVLSVILIFITTLSVGNVFAFDNETIEFIYNKNIYIYNLNENIKQSSQFDLNYEINKYHRFGSKNERQNLLKNMLNKNFDEKIALNYLFPNLDKKIEQIEKSINVKPKNAEIFINPNTEKVFDIKNEIIGIKLDKEKLYKNLANKYLSKQELTLKMPIITITPEFTKQYFKNFTNLRSDFSTNISSSSADRKHNIKNALNSLNKIEIQPGEVFSFNKCIGKRTEENGYKTAKIIVNNEFVEGLGGGVCQVSTTLYNSALLAGLDIIEANKHSKQVSYVKYGFDAMVNFGSSDLKFKNNLTEKITIITNYSPSKIRIRIFGEDLNNKSIKLTNEISNIIDPQNEIIYDTKQEYLDKVQFDDESFQLKKGNRGMDIKSYRETYVNNELVKKELLRTDKYKVQNSVIVYGTKKRTELCA